MNLKAPVESVLKDLIRIPSESGNEKAICDEIEKTLKALGIRNIKRKSNNLVVKLTNLKNAKSIALIGHLDTVKVASKDQFVPKVKAGKLYGRGAVDMKAGDACMLKIAYEIATGKLVPKNNITLVFYEKEEVALPNGINVLLDAKLLNNIDFCYVLEPTECEYTIGCFGYLAAKIVVKGKSAHTALPKEGINAVYKALPIIKKVENFKGIMSVTQINTSNSANVTPGECTLMLNYRFSPPKTVAEARKDVLNLVKTDVEFIDDSPSCILKGKHEQFLKSSIKKTVFVAWSDVVQLNLAGIPAVNFGPGSISLAHKANEYISVKKLNQFYKILRTHC